MKTFNIRSGFIPQRSDDWSFEMFEPYIKVGVNFNKHNFNSFYRFELSLKMREI